MFLVLSTSDLGGCSARNLLTNEVYYWPTSPDHLGKLTRLSKRHPSSGFSFRLAYKYQIVCFSSIQCARFYQRPLVQDVIALPVV